MSNSTLNSKLLGSKLISKLEKPFPLESINNAQGKGRLVHFIIPTDYDWNIEIPEAAFANLINGDLIYLSLKDTTQNLYEPKAINHSLSLIENLKRIGDNTRVVARKYTRKDLTHEQVRAIQDILNHNERIGDISIVLSRTETVQSNKPFDFLLSAMGRYIDISKLPDNELPEVFQDIFIYHWGNLYSLKQSWINNDIDVDDIIGYISELIEDDETPDPDEEDDEILTSTELDNVVDNLLHRPKVHDINRKENSEADLARRKLAILKRAIPDSEFKKIRISGPDSDYINYDVRQHSIWINYTQKPLGDRVQIELPEDLKKFLEINIIISNLRDIVPTIRDQLELGSKVKPLPEELYQKYSKYNTDAIECFVMVKLES